MIMIVVGVAYTAISPLRCFVILSQDMFMWYVWQSLQQQQ